ncbi:MAG: hypothetical protein HKN45_02225 [Flavobacteriales bacterium]|nr:hypothetical protein [Flavobacteriales bacterium]NNK80740.1 hypothetical protein [Flavobacteriales bacterium]
MKQLRLIAMALVAGGMMFTACDKDDDDDDDPDPQPTAKEVMVVVKPVVGNDAIQLNTTYDINGQMVSFSNLKFYLSNFELMDDAGMLLADNDGLPILADTDQNGTMIGSTDAAHLHMLRFGAGVDSTANAGSPITNPFPLDDTEMHWNWNPGGGYKSFVMEGTVDGNDFVSHAAAPDVSSNVIYQDGIVVDLHTVSTTGDLIQIELLVDIADMLDGLTIPNGPSMGTAQLNQQYMSKLGTGTPFSVE